jgi:hypothetical protein
MSERALQALIGHAIVDKKFRDQLLNGGRERLLEEFELTETERDVLRSIQAQTFEEFASQVHMWILQTRNSNPIHTRTVASALHLPDIAFPR